MPRKLASPVRRGAVGKGPGPAPRQPPTLLRPLPTVGQEMECAGILLFVQRGAGVLLTTEEVKQLLEQKSVPLYIVPLLPNQGGFPHPRWLTRWFNR